MRYSQRFRRLVLVSLLRTVALDSLDAVVFIVREFMSPLETLKIIPYIQDPARSIVDLRRSIMLHADHSKYCSGLIQVAPPLLSSG
jgi:hypothetical protein